MIYSINQKYAIQKMNIRVSSPRFVILALPLLVYGQVSITPYGTATDDTSYRLECSIPSFTGSGTWAKDGNTLTICTPTVCTVKNTSIYQFTSSASGIQVVMDPVSSIVDGLWKCTSSGIFKEINVTSIRSQSVAKTTNKPATKGLISQGVSTASESALYSGVDAITKKPRFTSSVVRKWHFSSRYIYRGRVVYGIQILIIAAVNQFSVLIPAVIVLGWYAEENEIYLNVLLGLLILVWPALANGLYLLYKAFFGQKEWIHIKFEEKLMYRSLSDDDGIKFNSINKDKIWFKVWARDDVQMTLYGNKKKPFLNIILGYGAATREFDDHKPVVVCDNVLSTNFDYRIFYLTCEEHFVKVVRVLNGKEETVLNWDRTKALDSRSEPLSDIIVSNYMREIREKDVSIDTADTGGLVYTKSLTGTRGEWIFFIRQGDRLYEDDDDFRVSKTSQLIVLVILPFAWLVLPFQFFGKERNTKEIKDRKG